MEHIELFEIGIVDTRQIVKTIKDKYGVDFSEYALTSFKRRLERFITSSGCRRPEILIEKLKGSEQFFDEFLAELNVPSTELFRDPSLWRWLRDDYLQDFKNERLKILIPECVSGDELYTLAIVLKEMGIYDNCNIHATVNTELLIDRIKKGNLNAKKLDPSIENYKRYQGDNELDVYYTQNGSVILKNKSILDGIEFHVTNLLNDELPVKADIILFRNHLIYYSPGLQTKMLDKLFSHLRVNGILILGAKENISGYNANTYNILNQSENVYRKKVS